jgi:hypothetical protein
MQEIVKYIALLPTAAERATTAIETRCYELAIQVWAK